MKHTKALIQLNTTTPAVGGLLGIILSLEKEFLLRKIKAACDTAVHYPANSGNSDGPAIRTAIVTVEHADNVALTEGAEVNLAVGTVVLP